MEIAAMISFLVLVVTWMALPDRRGTVLEERPAPMATRRAAAEA